MRRKAISIPLLFIAVTLAVYLAVSATHTTWIVMLSVGFLIAGILTADLSGPDDPVDEPILTGRQQLRHAARMEAYRQVGGAPVGRKVKRRAARDIARTVTGGD